MFRVLVLASLSFLLVPPAWAQCDACPDNLLADRNCDADVDASVWEIPQSGTLLHEPVEGVPPGSVEGQAAFQEADYFLEILLCAPAVSSSAYSASVALKTVEGDVVCTLSLKITAADDCTNLTTVATVSNQFVPEDLSDWSVATAIQPVTPAHGSIALRVTCGSVDPFTVLFDNAYLVDGAGGAPLFYGGFEAGDLEDWSSSVP